MFKLSMMLVTQLLMIFIAYSSLSLAQIVPSFTLLSQPPVSSGITLNTLIYDSADTLIASLPYSLTYDYYMQNQQLFQRRQPQYIRIVASLSSQPQSLSTTSDHREVRNGQRVKMVVWTGSKVNDELSTVLVRAFQSALNQMLYLVSSGNSQIPNGFYAPFGQSLGALPAGVTELEIELLQVDTITLYRRPLCQQNPIIPAILPCPTMVLANEMLLPSLIDQGLLMPLQYLAGASFTSSFASYANLFNWQYQNNLYNVPLYADVSLLAFNKNTYNALGLKQPPPYANWGTNNQDWTWQQLVNNINAISDAGYPGFEFRSGLYEDTKLINMIARSFGTSVIDGSLQSNMQSNEFQIAIQNTLSLIQFSNADVVQQNERYKNWLAGALDQPIFANATMFTGSIPNPLTRGMTFVPSSVIRNGVKNDGTYVSDMSQADILPALLPGTSYLSVSGLSTLTTTLNPSFAWAIIQFISDAQNDFLDQMAYVTSVPPPYTFKQTTSFWQNSAWAVSNAQVGTSRPFTSSQPNTLVRNSDAYVVYGPLRLFVLEFMQKKVSLALASTRASVLINQIALPPCLNQNIRAEAPKCDPEQSYRTTLITSQSLSQQNCYVDLLQVSAMTAPISCPYVVDKSPIGISMLTVDSLAMAALLILTSLVIVKRGYRWISSLSLAYCLSTLIGAIMIVIGAFLFVGVPNQASCVGRAWLMNFGVVLFADSMAVLALISAVSKQENMKFRRLYGWMILGLLLVSLGPMLAWTLVSQRPGLGSLNTSSSDIIGGNLVTIRSPICLSGSKESLWAASVWNLVVMAVGFCALPFTHKIVHGYQERTLLFVSLLLAIVTGVTLTIVASLLTVLQNIYATVSLVSSIMVTVIALIYFIPKLIDKRHRLSMGDYDIDEKQRFSEVNFLSNEKTEEINRIIAEEMKQQQQLTRSPQPLKQDTNKDQIITRDAIVSHSTSLAPVDDANPIPFDNPDEFRHTAKDSAFIAYDLDSITEQIEDSVKMPAINIEESEDLAPPPPVPKPRASSLQPADYSGLQSAYNARYNNNNSSVYSNSKEMDLRQSQYSKIFTENETVSKRSSFMSDNIVTGQASWYNGSIQELLNEFDNESGKRDPEK